MTDIHASFFNSQIYDSLFKAIFGRDNPQSKQWRLDLYNALRGTDYSDPNALELNTIENVIYLTMRNDISFLVDSQMTLWEQQSSYNPNMPLRGLMYFAQLYQIHLTKQGKTLHRSTRIEIPNPQFIVFYNGEKSAEDIEYLKLSDCFINKEAADGYEWTAKMININSDHNKTLQKKCKPLYDYVRYVSRLKKNKKNGMSGTDAVNEAVNWAIKENLLGGFFKLQKEEILAMSLTEFNAEEIIRDFREEGREEGRLEGSRQKAIEAAKNLLKMKLLTVEQIAQAAGLSVETVKSLSDEIKCK